MMQRLPTKKTKECHLVKLTSKQLYPMFQSLNNKTKQNKTKTKQKQKQNKTKQNKTKQRSNFGMKGSIPTTFGEFKNLKTL